MNAFSTAAALTVLAATTAAFAAQTQEPSPPPSSVVPSTAPDSYQYRDSATSGRDSEAGANSDAASCLKGEATEGSATSTAFAATAAQDGAVEVALAGLALRKSSNDHVRQFAQQMVQDYAQSNGRLDSIVKCEGLVLPTELDAKHNATIAKLDATSGNAFDRAYLKHIAQRHSKAVTLFESASGAGDPELAAFARKGLSMLRQHKELAENLRVAMGPTVASMR